MRSPFREKNPRISHVHFLNIQTGVTRPGHRYAALATATTANPVDLPDELFGLFILDSTLTHVQATLDVLQTGRLLDYAVVMTFPAPDTILIRGFGIGDNETVIRHAYPWVP